MSFTDQRYAPANVVELAISQLIGAACGPEIQVYVGDEDQTKESTPYIVVSAKNLVEVVSPGTGIFEADIEISYTSKTKLTESDSRDDVMKQIHDLIYDGDGIVAKLNTRQNFLCYGYIDNGGGREFNVERKETIFTWNWKIVFTPRSSS
jgi:hypothetical protein